MAQEMAFTVRGWEQASKVGRDLFSFSLQALYNQYLQFKEKEIPPKETEKSKIKRLYKLLEVSQNYSVVLWSIISELLSSLDCLWIILLS